MSPATDQSRIYRANAAESATRAREAKSREARAMHLAEQSFWLRMAEESEKIGAYTALFAEFRDDHL